MDLFTEIFSPNVTAEFGKLYNYIGPVGLILIILSVVSLTLILTKCFVLLFTGRSYSKNFDSILKALQQGKLNDAQLAAQTNKQLTSKILGKALDLFKDGVSIDSIEADTKSDLINYFTQRAQFHRTLELIGLTAPLLGLLGTILGMISAFQALQVSGSQADPAVLAGGIWEALLTTALGLCVAIPAIIAFHMFEAQVEKSKQQIYSAMDRFFAALEHYQKETSQTEVKAENAKDLAAAE